MQTIMGRAENFAAAVAEAKTILRRETPSWTRLADKYGISRDKLQRHCDNGYRERRNAMVLARKHRLKAVAPPVIVKSQFKSVTRMMTRLPGLGANGPPVLVAVSLPRVRFLELPE